MRLAIRAGSAVMKQDGATAAMRSSSAPMYADWKPPPLVPVIEMRAPSTSGRVSR